jgi:cell shape-determining protein MreC
MIKNIRPNLKGISMEGKWLSILEYASYKNKSISTVRRYIKAGRVKYKEENGKYFIWTKNFFNEFQNKKEEKEIIQLRFEVERLKNQLRLVQEENEELKMLINIYESSPKKTLPELPDLPL